MFSAKINRPEGSERGDPPRRERECGFDRENNLDRPLLPPPGFSLSADGADDFFNGKFRGAAALSFYSLHGRIRYTLRTCDTYY